MFPFAGFNLLPSSNLITGFLDPKPGIFLYYNTDRINTFLFLKSSQNFYALSFKIQKGMIGTGIDSLSPFLGLGAYSENFWIFSALGSEGFYLNTFVEYKEFIGGMKFFLRENYEYGFGFFAGYSFKGFDLGLTLDTIIGTFLGYTWRKLYLFTFLGFSDVPKFGISLSLILGPESKRDTVRIEVPIYVQVPIIVRDTIYVRETVRERRTDTLQKPMADPKVVENLYLRGLEAYQKGNYAEALFFFQEILKLDPKNEKAIKAVERIRKILEER